jgi:uncharacterized membrane protein YphA (DoxX/SURF4 family)
MRASASTTTVNSRASCRSIVHACERRSSCRCYQGIDDTIVQLLRLPASGVIASSQPIQSEMRNEKEKQIMNQRLNSSWWALRIGLGVAPFLAGLDKFFNLLTNWKLYLNPLALRAIPVDPGTFLHAIGIVEMIVGLAILTRWTRLGAYVASLWLMAIALNLVTMGAFFDVAVRDILLALAAFTLARLTEVRQATAANSPAYEQGLVRAR